MKTVVITGATSGFGKEVAEGLLEKGFKVIVTGRNILGRTEVFEKSRMKFNHQLIEKNLDITDSQQIKEFVAYCESENTQIDILINNAGFGLFGPLEEMSEEQIRYQMEVNFFGTVLLTQKLIPLIRKAKGKILNFSSAFGFLGFPLTSLYCASKFAIEGWSESLYYELKKSNIQICIIEPGAFPTNFSANISWTTSQDNFYNDLKENYKKFMENRTPMVPKQDPRVVINGTLRLCESKKLPLRVQFGRDAKLGKVAKKLLPESLFLSSMRSTLKSVLKI